MHFLAFFAFFCFSQKFKKLNLHRFALKMQFRFFWGGCRKNFQDFSRRFQKFWPKRKKNVKFLKICCIFLLYFDQNCKNCNCIFDLASIFFCFFFAFLLHFFALHFLLCIFDPQVASPPPLLLVVP